MDCHVLVETLLRTDNFCLILWLHQWFLLIFLLEICLVSAIFKLFLAFLKMLDLWKELVFEGRGQLLYRDVIILFLLMFLALAKSYWIHSFLSSLSLCWHLFLRKIWIILNLNLRVRRIMRGGSNLWICVLISVYHLGKHSFYKFLDSFYSLLSYLILL